MTPRDNEVLARLDEEAWRSVAPFLERMDLRIGQRLYDRGEELRYIDFPVGAVVGIRCELPMAPPPMWPSWTAGCVDRCMVWSAALP